MIGSTIAKISASKNATIFLILHTSKHIMKTVFVNVTSTHSFWDLWGTKGHIIQSPVSGVWLRGSPFYQSLISVRFFFKLPMKSMSWPLLLVLFIISLSSYFVLKKKIYIHIYSFVVKDLKVLLRLWLFINRIFLWSNCQYLVGQSISITLV